MKLSFDSSSSSSFFHAENIPAQLCSLPQWVCWHYVERNGKRTKPPIDAKSNGKLLYAKSDDPSTWSDFATAVASAERLNLPGIGLALSEQDGLTGLDLDHVLNPDTGELDALANEVLSRFAGTYTEVSPSGDGLRIWCYGKPQRSGKCVGKVKWLEVYSHPSRRYLTVTGNHWPGSATAVTDQQAALNWLHQRFMQDSTGGEDSAPPKPRPSPVDSMPLDDAVLLDKAHKARNGAVFGALWAGDLSSHGGDHSAADMALLNVLAFWTSKDAGRMDRLFRQSGLMRPKWDVIHDPAGQRTYGQISIAKAITDCREVYSGEKKARDADRKRQQNEAAIQAQALLDSATPATADHPYLAKKAEQIRAEVDVGWRAELMRRADSDQLLKNHYNAVMIVENAYPGLVGYNEFRQRIEARIPSPWRAEPGQWTEADTGELAFHLAKEFTSFSLDALAAAIMTVAHRHAFNPAQERLRALGEQWDGQSRIGSWLVDYLGAAVNESNRVYLAEIGAAWLKGTVARVLKPGCKRDDVLILRGEQGYLKSTAANAIADCIQPDAFTDSLGNLDSKDAKAAIRGIIIAELGELSVLNKSDLESIKAFVAAKADHFREAYGRGERDYPRTVSFIGTTNHPTFLKDPTGNRRFWPVTIPAEIDIPRLKEILPQLLGEAARRVQDGEPWFVSDQAALAQANEVRAAHYQDDVWSESALNAAHLLLHGGACPRCGGSGQKRDTSYPDRDGTPGQCFQCHGTGQLPGANPEFVTVADILTAMGVRIEQQTVANQMRIGGILRVAGWTDRRKRVGDWKAGKMVVAWFPPESCCTLNSVAPTLLHPKTSRQIGTVQPVAPCSPSYDVLVKMEEVGSNGAVGSECSAPTNLPFYENRVSQGERGEQSGKQGINSVAPLACNRVNGVQQAPADDLSSPLPPVESLSGLDGDAHILAGVLRHYRGWAGADELAKKSGLGSTERTLTAAQWLVLELRHDGISPRS